MTTNFKTIRNTAAIILMLFAVTTTAQAQNWSGWSEWQQSSCYEGIWTRHRSHPSTTQGKQRVQVEVRNSYPHAISVSTRLTNDRSDLTIYRLEIPAGKTISDGSTEAFLYSGREFYFLHDKVRFEGDNYGDNYRPCDRY